MSGPDKWHDGEITERGESYIAPATNRKGPRSYPAFRDPDNVERNLATIKRHGRFYGFAVLLLLVAAVLFGAWLIGYAMGYLDGEANRPQRLQTKESIL